MPSILNATSAIVESIPGADKFGISTVAIIDGEFTLVSNYPIEEDGVLWNDLLWQAYALNAIFTTGDACKQSY